MNGFHDLYDNCMSACDACAHACDACTAGCLADPDTHALAACIALDIECAQLCRLASAAMARDSVLAPQVCALCARACEVCAAECLLHAHDHCRRCALACDACAAMCRAMA
ncbi:MULTISPECIES: four-helix bundle copper-binding protein [unclassified Burkholderia]|uniref:four-helix bundle copper-binding protein n=1 Tax=unclassified Burkholderia TaxID=2613784 RepID=UPI000F567A72|nr:MULTISPECIES: four-helix bundle copper-binding protein [unclassified Burkholderia]RQR40810.1 four-helix bundle copper-binding protein [Burkholderia sp. Bp9131]RQR69907.1 four-helix bundle copper-binding protein [Burkholderia sp. Bp9015]RQS46386.1 four-helix bundle copper-binding protein [Burkholderia sp. Bp8990]RQZ51466.1 four-helix bundle copper-binding protein [Burkholderia sp. Bp9099]